MALGIDMLNTHSPNFDKIDDYKDTSNYHGAVGVYEPINVMEYAIDELVRRGLPAHTAMNVGIAIKYLLRLGTKDYTSKELFKAENFIHRARIGSWMESEQDILKRHERSGIRAIYENQREDKPQVQAKMKQLDEDMYGGK